MPFGLTQKQLAIVLIGAILVGGIGFFLYINMGGKRNSSGVPGGDVIELTAWGPFPEAMLKDAIDSFDGAKIIYTQIEPSKYKKKLLDALAAGKGPDIYMVDSRALPQELERIVPAPGGKITPVEVQQLFPDVVTHDFVYESEDGTPNIYGLPLYLDTLALVYNKDIFNQEAVLRPPATWEEFQQVVQHLRKLNQYGQITRAAAAIGGSKKSIANAVDILNLLMLQNGTKFVDEKTGHAVFAGGRAGEEALNFYLQFGNAGSPYYTWNDLQGDFLQRFVDGKVAMIFAYKSQVNDILARAPFLNFAIAPVPQPEGREVDVNYPSYWGLVVSSQTREPEVAWDFVVHAATDEDAAQARITATNLPPALKSLYEPLLNDPSYYAFVQEALTAKSWHQPDEELVQEIFSTAMQRVLAGKTDVQGALQEAEEKLNEEVLQ
ncbi:extracellular solute-binding protein [Candidatus Parcubacteria bacterium]|nr:MAG: extracellular solute-binding protein [Candidatus Parcubacteria bacterium]